ncbi:TPA: hypothetical protein N6556_005402, partial [Escherichia coli]|nr:hypothetical protein [Escherichia coli]
TKGCLIANFATVPLQPPGKINGKNVLQHLDRLSSIESLALPEGIDGV